MNNAVFKKTMENIRNHRDIKFITNDAKRNYLMSEPNYHTTNFFSENLLPIEMKRTQILLNKKVCLSLSISELSKIVMYECWYDYMKSKYGERVKLSSMDSDSFIACITQTLQKMLK